ncbi:hypothetical protein LDENG_00279870 [Lucifuga dentata]|nr:hypothetical protein LDENG_00279870 [Lucifuga dentata]
MSASAESHRVVAEEIPLNTIPGSGEMEHTQNDTSIQINCCSRESAATCCEDKHHRKLAICSIICGISCIGMVALINAVKAKQAQKADDPNSVKKYSTRARKYSIISIVVWVTILVFTPILMVLISYLVTLID